MKNLKIIGLFLLVSVGFNSVYSQSHDADIIKKNIKTAFEKWNVKGEFEKEANYIERLKTQSKSAFDSICLKQIKGIIKNKYADSDNFEGGESEWKKNLYLYKLEKELLPYNSEKEFFTVSFKINGISWQSNINVPIAQAENFKNRFSSLSMQTGIYDWCFVGNSLCPTLVMSENQYNDTKYQFPVRLQNQSEITQSFDNLGIDNQYLKGYVFKYSEAKIIAKQQAREKRRLDSLELATFNNRLDSVFQDYNKQLLTNPYNLKQSVLKSYDKISVTDKDSRQNSFDRKVSDMKSEFNRVKSDFEYARRNEYGKNGKLFASETEFDSFYTKGESIYQAEVGKRQMEVEKKTMLKYFSDNAQAIETMNFQEIANDLAISNYYSVKLHKFDYSAIRGRLNEEQLVYKIIESKNKPYYSQLIDFVVETNKILNKEWNKNGKYFDSKSHFYDAFLSGRYQQILKDNKK